MLTSIALTELELQRLPSSFTSSLFVNMVFCPDIKALVDVEQRLRMKMSSIMVIFLMTLYGALPHQPIRLKEDGMKAVNMHYIESYQKHKQSN